MMSGPSEDQRRVTNLIAAVTADEGDFRVGNLPLWTVDALQLPGAFDDLQNAFDMRLRKLAAGGVGRQRTPHAQRAGANKLAALALFAEAVVLELGEHHVGEAVVDLRSVDILRAEACHFESALAALDCAGREHMVLFDPALGVVVGGKA